MPDPLRPLPSDAFDYWQARHLLARAGFGGTPAEVRELASIGLDAAIERLVDHDGVAPEPVRADRFDATIMRPETAEERAAAAEARRRGDEATLERLRQARQRRQRADRRQVQELRAWWLERMLSAPRPLEEKMTLFWHGHFATGYRTIENSWHMFRQNQLFRRHATGSFRTLVHEIIRDPAMLRYLDNHRNVKGRTNENLARELMELFTLGEGHAYTERDIREGARALTGWTYEDDAFIGTDSEQYAREHDAGPKRILGQSGPWDGDDFVEIILRQRAVSEFITLKLYRAFVNDLPAGVTPEARRFIEALARRFRASGYDVAALLRTLFRSAHFHDAANVAARIKSPVELIVGAIRTLRTPVRSVPALLDAMELMGQSLLQPPSVKGWDGGRAWINTATLYVRQNTLVYLLTGRRPAEYAWADDGAVFEAMHMVDHLALAGPIDPKAATRSLLHFTLGRLPHADRVGAIEEFFARCGDRVENDVVVGALALIAAMPEYQLC